MDKENKLNNAYDPDAAELLKGLDLDDDEDEFDDEPAAPSPQSSHSLLNILTSSTSLDALTAVSSTSMQALGAGMAMPSYSSASDLTSKTDDKASDNKTSENVVNTNNDDDEDAEDTVVVERPSIPVVTEVAKTADAAPSDLKDASPKDSSLKPDSTETKADDKPTEITVSATDSSPFTPIKPFEVRTPAPVTSKPAKLSTDGDNRETNDSVSLSGRRPPVPPPMPAGGMMGQGRMLRDGEIIITNDALSEMLPGGKNDEARDLAAIKFNDNEWYKQVFNEDYFRTVPRSSPRQTEREAKFIIDRLGIESGARVLDLCCGFGRHAIELSKRKYEMVGLDLSMVMLKKALADAQARNMAIKFVHGDMRKLTFKAIFDAIYNVQTSFGYFDDLSNFKVLQGIHRALKPGGVFLIETVNRDFIVNELPLRLWWQGHECKLLEEIDLDYLSGVLKVQRSFVFDTVNRAPWEQKIQIRLYTANEMRALLMRAGFNVLELSGDYSLPGAHFGSTSPKNIFVAEKPVK